MGKLKFKKDAKVQYTSDFWYDCTSGGYIKPHDFLEADDAARVKEAIELLEQFQEEAQELELLSDL